jgi:hypothetical protein
MRWFSTHFHASIIARIFPFYTKHSLSKPFGQRKPELSVIIYKIFFILVRSLQLLLLSIVISAFPNQKLSTLLYHNLLNSRTWWSISRNFTILSQCNKIIHCQGSAFLVNKSSLILSLLISEFRYLIRFQKLCIAFSRATNGSYY